MSKLTAAQVDEMAELREAGWSYQRLADRYGVSAGAMHYRCLVAGALSPRSRRPTRGERRTHGHGFGGTVRHFSEAEDSRLLQLARQGMKIDAIAAELGRARTSTRIRLLTLELKEELA
jgi:hypothetical protein